ncbi:MAG TPA: hypothetical protein VL354_10160 [Spirochaetia bacterium]|nr:hypothetical protein [Spirochaetia bacterium]
MDQVCANYVKCPIYNGILKDLAFTSEAYRKLYCDAGAAGWGECKRYLVKQKTGKCPEKLLPNSQKSVDDIIAYYKLV